MFLLCITIVGLRAQPKSAYCPAPNSRFAGKMTAVDTTRLRVVYAFNAGDVKNENTYMDMQRLDVGRRVTKYYSDFLFRSDSLIEAWIKEHPAAGSVPRFIGNGGKKKDTWSEYEYSDLFVSGGEMTVYVSMPLYLQKYNSRYTEAYPSQTWQIGAETQTIIGYQCQNATCHWRGRDYVAWFTTDIPVMAGPWKFGGLPGLILKVHDTENMYRFEAVQILSTPYLIYIYDFAGYSSSTREKVLKLQRTFNENWYKSVGYHKASVDASGNVVAGEPVSKHTPYSPLELE